MEIRIFPIDFSKDVNRIPITRLREYILINETRIPKCQSLGFTILTLM